MGNSVVGCGSVIVLCHLQVCAFGIKIHRHRQRSPIGRMMQTCPTNVVGNQLNVETVVDKPIYNMVSLTNQRANLRSIESKFAGPFLLSIDREEVHMR